ncbi:MAG: lamin tail domain-containing protein [Verrucomicrobiota bacterium]
MSLAQAGRAQTLVDLGATAPNPGADDIAQLSTTGNQTAPDGLNYYTDNQTAYSAGEPGQTFQTGPISAGYTMVSLAIKTAGLGSYSGTGTPQPYYLHLYSTSGGNAIPLQTNISANITFNDGDWLQWTNLSVPLAANTTYAWSFGKASSTGGWEALAVASGSPYAEGEIGLFFPAGGAITFGAGFDAVFDLGLAVPLRPTAGVPAISPTNNPVYAGTPVRLSEAASGQAPLHYQWRTDGGGGTLTNLPGAVATNLNLSTTGWAAGAYRYAVAVSNSLGVSTSSVAVLNVVAGSAPVLVSDIAPNPALGYVGGSLTFSAAFTGTLPIAYQWRVNTGSGATNIPGATNTSLLFGKLQLANAGNYTLLASNSLGGPVATSTARLTVDSSSAFAGAVLQAGPVAYWRLNETNSTSGGNLTAADQTGNFNGVYGSAAIDGVAGPGPAAGFPGFESFNTAAEFTYNDANSFITIPPLNLNTNTVTVSAWIYPIGTPGSYCGLVFCRPDGDASGFNFSSGGQLGYTWNQNNSDTWGWSSGLIPPLQQWSFVALVISPQNAVIYLCNTDGVQSATNAVASTAEAFNAATLIGDDADDGGNGGRVFNGSMDEVAVFNTALSQEQVLNLYFNGVAAAPQASVPTAAPATNLFAGASVVFSELALGVAPFEYQWETNGVAWPGATNNFLSLSNLTPAASGNYSVIVSDSLGTATSAPVALSVTLDTNPPVVLRAFNIGTTNLEVDYSKTVAAATATNVANYFFTSGLAISAVSLADDNSSVLLTTAPLIYGTNYTLIINGVLDRALPPNAIATNTTVTFQALPIALQDIGNPTIATTFALTTNGLSVTASGSAFGGTSDQGSFAYQLCTSNFDVSVCVADLGLSDVFALAGLMARETLDADGRFAACLATPAMNGTFFEWRDPAGSTADTAGSFPANYPHTWLRLQRVGNTFNGYAGYDGQTWTLLGTDTISMPAQIYLGYVVSSHNTNAVTTAQFSNLIEVTNAVIAAVLNPHEPMGPSSRLTPVVFSQIMWRPAPRTDGKNLECLTLYNSNPWFQDISSYQLTCADLNYTFPAGTQIPGGGYVVVAAAPADVESVYGITNVMGPYNGSLKHSETLELLDEETNVLLTVPYTDVYPWPVAAAGTGHSLVLAHPSYGEADPRAWDISDTENESPGQMDPYTPSPLRNVVINEILPHTENPAVPQFIELYNHSTNSVDVSGCILTDDPTTNQFVLPAGTVIGPAGFVSFTQSQFRFALNGQGETLYFIKPDNSRVLDAVQFGAQADGVSYGRWPDGANDFYAFTTNTPGTNNSAIVIGNIVINELMYDPISGSDDDQFIELYNQGTNTVNLTGWQFTAGVNFTFPSVNLAPNGYLVVAKNMTNLFAKYPNLNSGNTVGNYSGKLSHNGELVELAMPEAFYVTNTILVEEDEVTYGTGGRWGEWSSGGGSSLELIDPHANHRLAPNWADSDDTAKTVWTNVTCTGVLDNGANYDPSINYAQIGLLDAGECLVDNIQVKYNGSNFVSNGTFESGLGLANWTIQGCMACSSLESTGYQSGYSLHIRSSDRIWPGDNSCEVALNPNPLVAGQTVTLSYEARWLHGWPEPLLRLNGNWLEATAALPIPANLGTPGGANSQWVTNAGPAIYNVTHTPSLPAAGQPAVVTAKVSDPHGVRSLMLCYRLDPATNYTAVPMLDNGAGGDAVPGDGVFSATIPGQAAGQIAAYYIAATDGPGTTTRFPAIRPNDNEPVRECVVMFGDGSPGGSFGAYHLWLTQTNVSRWANLGNLSRDWKNDCTFVYNGRVIYNLGGRYSGSPYHQDYDTPVGSPCSYEWQFSDDERFLGATDFKKLHPPGADPGSDLSLQRSQLAFTFQRALGEPWLYKRYVAVYVNGNRRGTLMEDTQVPNSDVVKEHFPNDSDGYLFKMQPWFEMAPFLSDSTIGFDNQSWCNLMPYTTTGGVKKTGRYRWNYELRRTPDSDSDFTNAFLLVDAANSSGTANYVANLEGMADMENWMRVFAANHAAGCWDSFGSQNAQNLFGYIGTLGTKYTLLMWELETVFGNNGSWGPGQNLFTVNPEDPNMAAIYSNPTFLRMYWRALQDLVNGPLNSANSAPLLEAKYTVITENGLSVEDPAVNIEPWLSQAQSSIAAQLAAVNATNFAVNSTVTTVNNMAYITGTAPVNVVTVWINGAAYPLTWTSLTNWLVTVPLATGTNSLNVVAVGENNLPITGGSNTLSVVYSGTNASPAGQVVINEIMYAPAVDSAQFVELYNSSTNATFDLSGWQIAALDYTFPDGSVLGPTNYLVLAQYDAAFARAYGATNPVFDLFTGTLQPPQLLTLVQPGGAGANNVTVTELFYDSAPPWPTHANGTGASLQLIDPDQDNWRVGNWSATALVATPNAVNSVAAALAPFPSLWINEVQPDNLTGITNRAGQHTPWLELYNPSTNFISLNRLYLANNYTNLLQWAFPTNANINAGQFKVIFADVQTNLSTTNELHTSFMLPSSTGSLALTRLATNGQQQVLDYLNYQNIGPNYSYGSFPDGQSFNRQEFFLATPGGPNNGVATPPPSFIDYPAAASVYEQNFDTLPDPGATSVNSGNTVTIDGSTYSLANPYDFAYPAVASGSSGGLDIPALAGWYGTSVLESRFGASDGDQTAGGQNSFGPANSSNRALGLLATSTTGGTAFGARFINGTGLTLNRINLQFTGEAWRQSNLPKTLQFYYVIDPTGTNGFPASTGATAFLPALNVNFPTVSADTGGAAVDGTSPLNQTNLGVLDQAITNWPPGAALWLVWQMTDSTGKAQGLAIDNLSFSASVPLPAALSAQTAGTNLLLNWSGVAGQIYQLEYKTNLASPAWTPLGNAVTGTGGTLRLTNGLGSSPQRFFRLQLLN